MINRNCIIYCVLTLLLVAYCIVMLPITKAVAAADPYAGYRIALVDSIHSGFVSDSDVVHECGNIGQWISSRPRSQVNLDSLERKLRSCDKFQTVNVYASNNGTLVIEVVSMQPVARVFDNGLSYYVNYEGKRIGAEPRYHLDVPVVLGHFTAQHPVTRLLPLLDYISAHPQANALVSTVKQQANGDIILVPTIRGHVINFGDTTCVDNKFRRLTVFYNKVMPVRGWETYDTISVKWRGSIVATRRDKELQQSILPTEGELPDYVDDVATMSSAIPDSILAKKQ